MSGTEEFLFGIFCNGVITAMIVTVAVVWGRREANENKTELADLSQEAVRRAS